MIEGNDSLTNLDGLSAITSVGGDLRINSNDALTNLDGLGRITSVGEGLDIHENGALTHLDGLNGITSVTRLSISGNAVLTNLNGLSNLISLGNVSIIGYQGNDPIMSGSTLFICGNDALTNLNGLNKITSVGSLVISSNNALTNLNGLSSLTKVIGYMETSDNNSLTSLNGLNNLASVGGTLQMGDNKALPDCAVCNLLNQLNYGTIDIYDNLDDTCTPVLARCSSFEAVAQDFGSEDQDAGTDDQSSEQYRVELKEGPNNDQQRVCLREQIQDGYGETKWNGNYAWCNEKPELDAQHIDILPMKDLTGDSVPDVIWVGKEKGPENSYQFYGIYSPGDKKLYWLRFKIMDETWCFRNQGDTPRGIKDGYVFLVQHKKYGLPVKLPSSCVAEEYFEVRLVEEGVGGYYNVHLYRNGDLIWRNTIEELMRPRFMAEIDARFLDADGDGVGDVVWWGGDGGSGFSSQFYAVYSVGKGKLYWRYYAWKRGQWSNAAGGHVRGLYRCRRNTGKVPKPVKDLFNRLVADPEDGLATGKPQNYKCIPAKKPGIEWFRKKPRKPTPRPDFW